MLDASADKDIVEAAFSKSFEFEPIRVEYQPNVKVSQFENKLFSKRQLSDDKHLTDKVNAFIQRKSKGKSFGLITHKKLEDDEQFAENLAQSLKANEWGYFGDIRGIDKFKECGDSVPIATNTGIDNLSI